MSDLAEKILEIVCVGKHKRGGPACEKTCGIQVRQILEVVTPKPARPWDVCAAESMLRADLAPVILGVAPEAYPDKFQKILMTHLERAFLAGVKHGGGK